MIRPLILALALTLILGSQCCAADDETSDVLTWAEYWDEHPYQEKGTRPVRWVWHHGPEQAWAVTGLPVFRSFCAFGKWSHQSGLTQGVAAVGAAGSVATPFVAGFKKF